jgi:hypothetical protein
MTDTSPTPWGDTVPGAGTLERSPARCYSLRPYRRWMRGGSAEKRGLRAYGISFRENFRRAAIFVDKPLTGARPADLPVEQPTTFELIVNLKTAQALGLKHGHDRLCWVSQKCAEKRSCTWCLKGRETGAMPLEKLTSMALEIDRRALTNRVTTSFTLVGNSADSPEPLLRPSPATGHDVDMLEISDPDLGYDAETCPSQPPQQKMRPTCRAGLWGG